MINYLNPNMELQFTTPFTHGIINRPNNFQSISAVFSVDSSDECCSNIDKGKGVKVLGVPGVLETMVGSDTTASYPLKDCFFLSVTRRRPSLL